MKTGLTKLTGLEISGAHPENLVNPVDSSPRLRVSAVKKL
jgi:hypothetical protein